MKTLFAFAVAVTAMAPTAVSPAQAAETQARDVSVDITDTDPKGTNVRANPGGAVIASLSNPNVDGWIAVHTTGQSGDWYEVDRASLINADLGPDGKIVFQGKGYLHKSVPGVSGMQNGGTICWRRLARPSMGTTRNAEVNDFWPKLLFVGMFVASCGAANCRASKREFRR